MKFDAVRVLQLLNIVEKTTTVAPGYNHLIGEAMAELRQINEDVRKANEVAKGRPVTPAQYGDKHSARAIPTTEYSAPDPVASAPLDDQTPDDAPAEILKEPLPAGYKPGESEAKASADSTSDNQPSLLDRRI